MKTPENTRKLLDFVGEKFESRQINNDSLVQLIELCGSYLNLQTIANYAKTHNMSYNGVKKCRKVVVLFNNKYVIDNS
jgi:hypothetical protein